MQNTDWCVGGMQLTDVVTKNLGVLSKIVDLSFAVHKLAKFSANPGKVHFEVLIHLLR